MSPGQRRRLVAAAALAALAALVYLPSLSAGFVFDDVDLVPGNPLLGSARGLWRFWTDPTASVQYYPLVYTSFWLEHQLVGTSPLLYHLDNLVLHTLVALAFFGLLLRLGAGFAAALIAAAIFVAHPVHVESVAWVAERKNLLSALFYLLAARAYLRFAGFGDPAAEPTPRGAGGRWPVAALALYCAALLSKAVTLTLPAALLIVLWWRGRLARRTVLPLVPMAVAGLAAGLAATWIESHHAGAMGPDFSLTPLQRAAVAGRALWFYLGKLAWPSGLALVYPRWRLDAGGWPQLAWPAAAACAAALLVGLRSRIGRGPAAAFALYVTVLLPTLGLIDFYFMFYSFVGDHFQYLASLGPIALAGAALARLDGVGARRAGLSLAVAALLVPLVVLARRHVLVFADEETLWTETARVNPSAELAHGNLGVIFERRGEWERAEASYRLAVRLRPEYDEARLNLGALLANRGRVAEGLEQFLAVLRHNPADIAAHLNAARALRASGRGAEAAGHEREAERLLGGAR